MTYNAASDEQINDLITESQYCTQFTNFQCQNAKLLINDKFGWYQTTKDSIKSYWGGNTNNDGCKGGKCNCDQQDGVEREDGGLLLNKNDLPIRGGNFQAIDPTGKRCWRVDSLKCYSKWNEIKVPFKIIFPCILQSDIYKHCHQIRQKNARFNPLGNNKYAIDPDGAGGNNIFGVTCDFEYDKTIGITIVPHDNTDRTNVAKAISKVLNYPNVEITQMRGLISESEFCSQKLLYTCRQAVLLNNMNTPNSYFKDWSGSISQNWANADKSALEGCACRLLKTCPADNTCRCDSKLPILQDEGGWVTSLQKLPISQVSFDGIVQPNGRGFYSVGSLGCAPKPFCKEYIISNNWFYITLFLI